MSADVLLSLQVLLALLNTLAMGLFASHFMTERRARRAARRLYERFERLRWALALVLVGVVTVAEVDALRWLGRLAQGAPAYALGQAGGYALILAGLVVLHSILVQPDPGLDARSARRAAWRERVLGAPGPEKRF